MHSSVLRQRGSSQRSSMQMARATNTRLPQESRADVACGSTIPLVEGAAGSDEGTGLAAACASRGTGWPVGRGCAEGFAEPVLVAGVP